MQTTYQNGKHHEISVIKESQVRHTMKGTTESILVSVQANYMEKIALVLNIENHWVISYS